MQTFVLYEDYITLGQLLKELGLIATGGGAKAYLASHEINLNGAPENRRGKKLRATDRLDIPAEGLILTVAAATADEQARHAADKEEADRVKALVKKMNQDAHPKADKPKKKPASPFHK